MFFYNIVPLIKEFLSENFEKEAYSVFDLISVPFALFPNCCVKSSCAHPLSC